MVRTVTVETISTFRNSANSDCPQYFQLQKYYKQSLSAVFPASEIVHTETVHSISAFGNEFSEINALKASNGIDRDSISEGTYTRWKNGFSL